MSSVTTSMRRSARSWQRPVNSTTSPAPSTENVIGVPAALVPSCSRIVARSSTLLTRDPGDSEDHVASETISWPWMVAVGRAKHAGLPGRRVLGDGLDEITHATRHVEDLGQFPRQHRAVDPTPDGLLLQEQLARRPERHQKPRPRWPDFEMMWLTMPTTHRPLAEHGAAGVARVIVALVWKNSASGSRGTRCSAATAR